MNTACKPNIGLSFEIQHHTFATEQELIFLPEAAEGRPQCQEVENIHVYHFFLIKMENLQESSLFGLSALQLIKKHPIKYLLNIS